MEYNLGFYYEPSQNGMKMTQWWTWEKNLLRMHVLLIKWYKIYIRKRQKGAKDYCGQWHCYLYTHQSSTNLSVGIEKAQDLDGI